VAPPSIDASFCQESRVHLRPCCAPDRNGEPVGLNFQNRNGCIPVYQARQLLGMIEKYKENS
jgi:hypothetical protein